MTKLNESRRARWIGSCLLIAALASPSPCLAWGALGHQIVATITANDPALSANAQKHIKQLGMSLPDAAIWADCVKEVKVRSGKPQYDATDPYVPGACRTRFGSDVAELGKMVDYRTRNTSICLPKKGEEACHKQYHYADVAIERGKYLLGEIGTSNHDIVAVLSAAIGKLKGKTVTAPISIKDNREALLLIAHFVGDIHQPLHVGAIYLSATGQEIDPDAANPYGPATKTSGGNSIDESSGNLHHDWDTVSQKITDATKLRSSMTALPVTAGDVRTWPAQWASETVLVSRAAFSDLKFAGAGTGHWTVQMTDPTGYSAARRKLQGEQMAKAGVRLRQLLNAIWP